MERNLQTIQLGTRVSTSDDEHVGNVEEVGSNYLLARKGWLFVKVRYIPFDAVVRVESDGVYLNVAQAQLDTMAWEEPPPGTVDVGTVDVGIADTAMAQRTPETELYAGSATSMPQVNDLSAPVMPRAEAGDGEPVAFQEATFEVRARHEEVIVGKRARVVEEIVLTTNITERTQTVQDMVRRTRVELDELSARSTIGAAASSIETTATIADTPASVDTPSTATDEQVLESGTTNEPKRSGGRGRRRLT